MSRSLCSMYLALAVCASFFGQSTLLHAAECVVDGETLSKAKNQYAMYCSYPRADCDQVAGKWFCASATINHESVLKGEIDLANFGSFTVAQSPAGSSDVVDVNVDSALCVDTDSDGWGWDGEKSCKVQESDNYSGTGAVSAQPSFQSGKRCIDSDGDGWGWNGEASCRVTTGTVSGINTSHARQPAEDNSACVGPYTANDITDLLLVTGQSNVTGAETSVSATLDRWGKVTKFHSPDQPHPRVFAWTVTPRSNNAGAGWQVASLDQAWHDSAPGVGGIARNNFAFHFAKHVVTSEKCRVVGFVMVSEGGKGISHWDYNATGWNEVVMAVTQALAAIGRSSLDGILWHQGESDWIVDGTCFNVPRCRNNQPDYYAQKLYSRIADQSIPNPVAGNALIDRLRRANWFGNGKPFIAGKTLKAPVNLHLDKLNTDNDRWTACVDSNKESGLGIRRDDPFQNHYDADGLRELGVLYANEYIQMIR